MLNCGWGPVYIIMLYIKCLLNTISVCLIVAKLWNLCSHGMCKNLQSSVVQEWDCSKCWFNCGCQWNVFLKCLPFENRRPMVRFSIKIPCGVFGDCQCCYVCIEKYLALVSANFVISFGLKHGYGISSASVLEIPQPCTKPWCNVSFHLTLVCWIMLVEIYTPFMLSFYLWVPTWLSHNYFIMFRQHWSTLMLIWYSEPLFND